MREIGNIVELRASMYLQKCGYTILSRNFHTHGGELDIVAMKDALVFVEVKHRSNANYGSPAYMVTKNKQRLLIRAAQVFLKKYPKYNNYPIRFDVICALGPAQTAKLDWIKNAITVE